MAGTHLAFPLLMLTVLKNSEANSINSQNGVFNVKPLLDPKRRSEIVEETFLEQKDILLDMLETKLKEVRDKKKKKANGNGSIKISGFDNLNKPCDDLLQNIDVKVNINGISAIGDANLQLKYGNSAKGIVNLEADGISNVGKVRLEMGVGDTALYIPGLSNLFIDKRQLNCTNKNLSSVTKEEKRSDETRRSDSDVKIDETTATVVEYTNTTNTHHTRNSTHHSHHTHEPKNATLRMMDSPSSSTLPPIHVTDNNSTITNVNGNKTV